VNGGQLEPTRATEFLPEPKDWKVLARAVLERAKQDEAILDMLCDTLPELIGGDKARSGRVKKALGAKREGKPRGADKVWTTEAQLALLLTYYSALGSVAVDGTGRPVASDGHGSKRYALTRLGKPVTSEALDAMDKRLLTDARKAIGIEGIPLLFRVDWLALRRDGVDIGQWLGSIVVRGGNPTRPMAEQPQQVRCDVKPYLFVNFDSLGKGLKKQAAVARAELAARKDSPTHR